MKSFGAILAFTRERNLALLHAYRREVAAASYITLDEIGRKIVNSPAPRFWVSEERAAAVVSALMRGKPILDTMRPTKREMFSEIYSRVLALRKARPCWDLPRIIHKVVNSPAPKFYMKPSTAIERLFKIRNGKY
ncbi:MAG: hypothetical protein ACI305_00440 [Lepagella sp.]|mgnify:FL=1|jgi:hypothetical protein